MVSATRKVNMCDDQNECKEEKFLEGKYANYFKVGFNAFEFILDFGQCYEDDDKRYLHTRVVTSPAYIKAFLETLKDSLEQYEHDVAMAQNGKIQKGN
jgi:hypothetical protein